MTVKTEPDYLYSLDASRHNKVKDEPLMTEKLLRIPLVAKRLDISEQHARRLARRGALPGCIRVGSQYRVNPRVLQQFLEGQGSTGS